MRVVLAGASGLIGGPLATELQARGHRVTRLVRRTPASAEQVQWDPAAGRLDPEVLTGADAVICLSGVGVGDHRWTADYKRQILASRVDSVGTVARTLARLAVDGAGPTVLLAASAVGYYGDTGDAIVDETAQPGASFLADVCRQWEAAAAPAAAAGVRVTQLRTGLVLSREGGLLARLATVVRLGLGGRLGSGRQYMPWISLADEVSAIAFLLETHVAGPVNLSAPEPVTNADFTRQLGRQLHRPTPWVVPAPAARIVLGEFAGDVLTGQRAVPARLQEAGFTFAHPTLDTALATALG